MNLVTKIGITLFVITLTAIYASPASYSGYEHQAESSQDGGTTDFVLIITGGELLRGLYTDSHTQFITRALVPLGCRCVASLCVGDKSQDLKDALVYAKQHAPLIIVTGGLGPTDDDITRDVVAELTGIRLKEHPEALADLEKRFAGSGRELRENLRRQALTPVKGTYLPNPSGTAVGLVFDNDKRVIVALPGPPRELRPMLSNELIPYLSKRFGIRSIGSSLQMRFVGIGESSIDQAIQDHLPLPK
ncbi:MAG TPA: competence/damage-inducible protein A, partial [Acidobacteriota bacterium]|nr:competence/damage-inducible protein A [Acidobacteriota bacterium]